MCVIVWAWQAHPRFPLVVLANRDERQARASERLDWWPDAPQVLAGRDREAGGTWLGVSRGGRFAAITNRDGDKPPGAPSRGELMAGFLAGTLDAEETAAALAPSVNRYAGFNLLLGDGKALALVSNREPNRSLEPGIHGMANAGLDEAVPKVARLAKSLSAWCNGAGDPPSDDWLSLLSDARTAEDVAPASAIFVRGDEYGTRSSSIVIFAADTSIRFIERSFDAHGKSRGTASFDFASKP